MERYQQQTPDGMFTVRITDHRNPRLIWSDRDKARQLADLAELLALAARGLAEEARFHKQRAAAAATEPH